MPLRVGRIETASNQTGRCSAGRRVVRIAARAGCDPVALLRIRL
jgi:hypothetical protein